MESKKAGSCSSGRILDYSVRTCAKGSRLSRGKGGTVACRVGTGEGKVEMLVEDHSKEFAVREKNNKIM